MGLPNIDFDSSRKADRNDGLSVAMKSWLSKSRCADLFLVRNFCYDTQRETRPGGYEIQTAAQQLLCRRPQPLATNGEGAA
jgi:hypothetical protein